MGILNIRESLINARAVNVARLATYTSECLGDIRRTLLFPNVSLGYIRRLAISPVVRVGNVKRLVTYTSECLGDIRRTLLFHYERAGGVRQTLASSYICA